jgi:hypothetical protein
MHDAHPLHAPPSNAHITRMSLAGLSRCVKVTLDTLRLRSWQQELGPATARWSIVVGTAMRSDRRAGKPNCSAVCSHMRGNSDANVVITFLKPLNWRQADLATNPGKTQASVRLHAIASAMRIRVQLSDKLVAAAKATALPNQPEVIPRCWLLLTEDCGQAPSVHQLLQKVRNASVVAVQ